MRERKEFSWETWSRHQQQVWEELCCGRVPIPGPGVSGCPTSWLFNSPIKELHEVPVITLSVAFVSVISVVAFCVDMPAGDILLLVVVAVAPIFTHSSLIAFNFWYLNRLSLLFGGYLFPQSVTWMASLSGSISLSPILAADPSVMFNFHPHV